jgi:hypothetical protein
MRIRPVSSFAIVALVVAFPALPARSSGVGDSGRAVAYQDSSGVLHSLIAIAPDATTSATTGTVEVTYSIKLVSTFAKGTTFNCSSSLSGLQVTSKGATASYSENESVIATVSGSTATCVTTIPYSWVLLPASTSLLSEAFDGQYSVSAIQIPTSGSTEAGITSRSSSATFVSLTAIPSSGTTSKYTVNVTL